MTDKANESEIETIPDHNDFGDPLPPQPAVEGTPTIDELVAAYYHDDDELADAVSRAEALAFRGRTLERALVAKRLHLKAQAEICAEKERELAEAKDDLEDSKAACNLTYGLKESFKRRAETAEESLADEKKDHAFTVQTYREVIEPRHKAALADEQERYRLLAAQHARLCDQVYEADGETLKQDTLQAALPAATADKERAEKDAGRYRQAVKMNDGAYFDMRYFKHGEESKWHWLPHYEMDAFFDAAIDRARAESGKPFRDGHEDHEEDMK